MKEHTLSLVNNLQESCLGFSIDEIQLFIALDAQELEELANFRTINSRSILHRIAVTESLTQDLGPSYYRQLEQLLTFMKNKFLREDGERVTSKLIFNKKISYIRDLIALAERCGVQEIFNSRQYIANYCDSPEWQNRVAFCQERDMLALTFDDIKRYSQRKRVMPDLRKTTLEDFVSELTSLRTKCGRLEQELAEKSASEQAAEARYQAATASYDLTVKELTGKSEEIEGLQSSNFKLREELEQRESLIAELRYSIELANKKAEAAEQHMNSITRDMTRLQRDYHEQAMANNDLRRKLGSSTKKIEKVQGAINGLLDAMGAANSDSEREATPPSLRVTPSRARIRQSSVLDADTSDDEATPAHPTDTPIRLSQVRGSFLGPRSSSNDHLPAAKVARTTTQRSPTS
ncbi:chromosome segregation protein SMC (plasmid) [Legionella adelaidensis]|uniref:Chromosome partition protein Smc n=1 Tax=Legionella adelaidensis TaxID=45056 RepID=A0A0W0R1E8_9GAMM|nr:hypothetical protein [Legionella adelaidensis]KTC64911.1 Chromosome partition protein Smc [Legionella adelaidensis]VEH85594.1 chromosome segregation protein SMC [Legionella adelaidensis]